jgi:hypothetical protein
MRIAPVLAAGVLALSTASPALAAETPKAYADVVGNVKITSASTATVQVRYACSPDDPAVGLWVAVKQGLEPGETSSQFADAYAQSHAEVGTLRCDGKTHVQTFHVHQEEMTPWGKAGFGTLRKGEQTYVQFCLTPASGEHSHEVISGVQYVNSV